MNAVHIDASLQRLHDGTVGQLSTASTLSVALPAGGGEVADAQQRRDRGGSDCYGAPRAGYPVGAARPVVTTKLPPLPLAPTRCCWVTTSVSKNVRRKRNRALGLAARCLRCGRQADDAVGVDSVRNAGGWCSTSWHHWPRSPPLARSASCSAGPLWWSFDIMVLVLLVVEGVAINSGCCVLIR